MTRIATPVGWVRNTKVEDGERHRADAQPPDVRPDPGGHRPVRRPGRRGRRAADRRPPADAHRAVRPAGEEAGEGEHEPQHEQRPQAEPQVGHDDVEAGRRRRRRPRRARRRPAGRARSGARRPAPPWTARAPARSRPAPGTGCGPGTRPRRTAASTIQGSTRATVSSAVYADWARTRVSAFASATVGCTSGTRLTAVSPASLSRCLARSMNGARSR